MVNTQYSPVPGKLTSDQLKLGYWYSSHKLLIRRIIIFVLIILDVFLISFAVYGFTDYYFISQPQVSQLYEDLTTPKLNYNYLAEVSFPQPLNVAFVQVLRNQEGKYDLVAEVINPNNLWYAPQVTYHFEAGSVITESQTAYILPNQTKYLMTLGYSSESAINNPSIVIDNISWEKNVLYENLQAKVLNIEITEPKFESGQQLGLTNGTDSSRVSFSAFNNSAYNFWDVDMNVLLYRGSSLVYVNKIPFRIFEAGERQNIEFIIHEKISTPSMIEVLPDVDILNPASFKGFEGEG